MVSISRRRMRPGNPQLVIARAAALGFAILGGWLLACAKTPAAAHPAEAAAAAAQPGAAEPSLPPEVKPLYDKLDDLGKKVFNRVTASESSVCGDAQSLIKSWKTCRRSVAALRYVAKLIEGGYTDSEIGEKLANRYRPIAIKKIDVADAPMKGNPGAKITLVEFADYECPHCKRFQPVLHQILEEFRSDVKLYFKHYPLPQHNNAR